MNNQKLTPPLLLDGATGTNLYAAGMESGVCVEDWVLAHPDVMRSLQRQFVDAGCQALMAPTFGANRAALANYGAADRVEDYNRRLAALSLEAADGRALVAGDLSPTGLFIEPFGDTAFDELIAIYAEQIAALKDAGVDYIAAETMMGLPDARAAVLAAKAAGMSVTVTLTVDENGRLLSGGDPHACLSTLAAMGADAVGLNCSTGPEIILRTLKGLCGLVGAPLIAKPNAGLPRDGAYPLGPAEFAEKMAAFPPTGVFILGGCCGTAPAHLAKLRGVLDVADVPGPAAETAPRPASERALFGPIPARAAVPELACDDNLEDALMELGPNDTPFALIRVRAPEEARAFGLASHAARVPVRLLADGPEALETALKLYQGRALVDPRSQLACAELTSLSARYGAILA